MHLGAVIKKFDPICDGFHVDIMDNHFVPNLTWGSTFANAIDHASAKPTWVHLMVDDLERWLDILKLKQGSIVSFHVENKVNINKMISLIKQKGWKASLAVNPKTDLKEILPFAPLVDQILLMSVEPGFSGQAFIPEVIAKIEPLIALRAQQGLHFKIAMDGGINGGNISMLSHKGVDEFAIASGIFGESDPVSACTGLKRLT